MLLRNCPYDGLLRYFRKWDMKYFFEKSEYYESMLKFNISLILNELAAFLHYN